MAKMSYAMEVAIKNADWLDIAGPDRAAIELAKYYCQQIDLAEEHIEQDPADLDRLEHARKIYATVGKNLQTTLTSLGLNPEARGVLVKQEESKVVNPFDELKRKRQQKRGAAG